MDADRGEESPVSIAHRVARHEHTSRANALPLVGAFAEFERELIRERIRAGMAAAVKRGIKLGRHYALNSQAEALRLWYQGTMTKSVIARMFGVHMKSCTDCR
ncbi:recombinase family protein [Ralstonia pseudosolanacearum]